jgi:carboxylesterase type B
MLARQAGAKTEKHGLNAIDRGVSEGMMGLWAGFARTGKPVTQGVPDWPEYTGETDRYINICGGFEVRSGFSKVAQTPLK